jgi:hypothetical protein
LLFNGAPVGIRTLADQFNLSAENGILTVAGVQGKTQIEIFDISGKLLVSKQIQNSTQIDLPKSNGMYLVKISQNDQSFVQKIINIRN